MTLLVEWQWHCAVATVLVILLYLFSFKYHGRDYDVISRNDEQAIFSILFTLKLSRECF